MPAVSAVDGVVFGCGSMDPYESESLRDPMA